MEIREFTPRGIAHRKRLGQYRRIRVYDALTQSDVKTCGELSATRVLRQTLESHRYSRPTHPRDTERVPDPLGDRLSQPRRTAHHRAPPRGASLLSQGLGTRKRGRPDIIRVWWSPNLRQAEAGDPTRLVGIQLKARPRYKLILEAIESFGNTESSSLGFHRPREFKDV